MAITPGQVEFEKKEEGLKEKAEDFSLKKESLEKIPEKPIEVKEKAEIEKEGGKRGEEKPLIKEKEIVAEPSLTPQVAPTKILKTPLQQKIEEVLAQDLDKVYASMDEAQKKVFREEGERTAGKIEKIIQGVKVKTKKILDLIRQWLKLIPGVNKFFLEQEAKIKSDRILKLKK